MLGAGTNCGRNSKDPVSLQKPAMCLLSHAASHAVLQFARTFFDLPSYPLSNHGPCHRVGRLLSEIGVQAQAVAYLVQRHIPLLILYNSKKIDIP